MKSLQSKTAQPNHDVLQYWDWMQAVNGDNHIQRKNVHDFVEDKERFCEAMSDLLYDPSNAETIGSVLRTLLEDFVRNTDGYKRWKSIMQAHEQAEAERYRREAGFTDLCDDLTDHEQYEQDNGHWYDKQRL